MITKLYRFLHVIAVGCGFVAALSSCSLDESPRDQIPEEDAYKTADALYLNTVATLYSYIGGSEDGQGLQGTCRGVYDLQTFGSDEAMLPTRRADWYDGELWQDMYRHSWSAGHDIPKNAWLYLYKVITLCNHSLVQLEDHRRLLTQEQYLAYTSEVRALRAIYYWYLMDLFGRVPIITTADLSINDVRQSERSEVFQYIINELNIAYDYLSEEKSTPITDYYGRITQPVVLFVLAKLMLNTEVYADDDWTDGVRPDGSQMLFNVWGEKMNAWQAADFYCDVLTSNMNFELETSYENNFIVHNENSKENIWTIPMDKDLYNNQQQNMFRSYHSRHAAAYGFSGENGSSATPKTLQVFGYGTEDEDPRFDLNYWSGEVYDLDYNPVYDREGLPLVYEPEAVDLILTLSPYVETAGARMKKYAIDKNAMKDGKLMDNDIVLFRFADVLLMRAEALLRDGRAAEGQTYMDAVRDRANVPLRPLTLQNILDERLLELCWEGWRRQDMIRFGQYESLFEGDEYDPKVDERDGHTTVYPIPADVMALNHNLTQNPGY